jgi:hypothetical protein
MADRRGSLNTRVICSADQHRAEDGNARKHAHRCDFSVQAAGSRGSNALQRLALHARAQMRQSLELSWGRRAVCAGSRVGLVLEQPFVPGQQWHYNNGSAEVIGAVMEA